MNILDIILLVFIFALSVYGLVKGFVCFMTKVLAVLGTAMIGMLFGDAFGVVLCSQLGVSLFVGKLISYVLIFLAVVILLKIFSVYIHKGLAFLDMGIYDKFLGAVLVVLLFLGFVVLLFVGFNLFFDYNLLQNPAVVIGCWRIYEVQSKTLQKKSLKALKKFDTKAAEIFFNLNW